MTTGQFRLRVRPILVLALTLAALAAMPPPARAADPEYTVTGTFTYEVRPSRREIRVTGLITFTNHRPDWQFEWYEFGFEPDARRVRATASEGFVTVDTIATDNGGRRLHLEFNGIQTNESRTFRLVYELPGGARSKQTVSRAFVNFCTDLHAFDRGSIRVLIPSTYVVTPPRGMSSERKGRNTLFTRGVQDTPESIYECFAAEDLEAFRTESISLPDGTSTTVEAWNDDAEWADAVRHSLETDVPALQRTLGDLKAPEIARITETIPRSACARPGGCPVALIDPSTGTVSLGQYAATDGGVTDALASLWFGKDVFRDPWLTAGHAEWAQIASGTAEPCDAPPDAETSYNLADWRPAPLEYFDPDPEQTAYVRSAACAIALAAAEAAGTDRYVEAIAALQAGVDPFGVSSGEPRGTIGWKEWLDAVELLALAPTGPDSTEAAQLLAKYDPTLEADLEERATAFAEYRELTVAFDQAGPPAVVELLRDWDFEAAREAIGLAYEAWSAADDAGDSIPELIGRTTPVHEALFAATDADDLQDALDLGELQFELAADAADVLSEGAGAQDVLAQIGMIGTSPPSRQELVDAVAAVDAARVQDLVNERRAALSQAQTTGMQRLVAAGALLIVVTLAVIVIVRRRARSGARGPTPSIE